MSDPAARARVLQLCDSAAHARRLRLGLLEAIRRTVGFDAHAWLLTDPQTWVGTSPLADVPCLPELPALIRLKYLTALNRWTSLTSPVARLREVTDGDLSRSLVWRELLSRHGVGDVASCVFKDAYGCWGFLDLWRIGAGAQFTAAEAAFLADIAAPVTAALRRTQAATFAAAGEHRTRGPVVLLLSQSLEVIAQTPQTQEYLRVLVPPDDDRSPIPASAYNVAAQLLANQAGIDPRPPSARVDLTPGRWLTLRAAWIGDAGPGGGPGIAVTVEDSSPAERVPLFARAHGLSRRETELLGHLAAGDDTGGVARRMFLADYTVQDHLKSIFAKTATHSRRTLLARALGTETR